MAISYGRVVDFFLQAPSIDELSVSETLLTDESDYNQRIKSYKKVQTDYYHDQVFTP
jgi:hypothetical protein